MIILNYNIAFFLDFQLSFFRRNGFRILFLPKPTQNTRMQDKVAHLPSALARGSLT